MRDLNSRRPEQTDLEDFIYKPITSYFKNMLEKMQI
jgi:hypothetical protein